MQSLLREIEFHVLHFSHNICTDKVLPKMILFNIELARKIVPECLRLGDTFFTHMTVFGTKSKDDGKMPLHFDEWDIISCVFHIGIVSSGGATSYYSGSSASEPGEKIHQVPFHHGTLQMGFINMRLHEVEEWGGQRSGIEVNIKKDVLAHFVKHGSCFYNKYRLTGYPQRSIVFP